MLIADEVGLGKTIVAKGIIAKAYRKFTPSKTKPVFNVIYILSGYEVVRDTPLSYVVNSIKIINQCQHFISHKYLVYSF